MDGWLARLYERNPQRYLPRVFGLTTAVPLLTLVPGFTQLAAHYEGLSTGQTAASLLVLEVMGFLNLVVGAVAARGPLAVLSAWIHGDRDPGLSTAVSVAAFEAPVRFARGFVFTAPFTVIAGILLFGVPSHHTAVVDIVELSLGGVTGFAIAAFAAYQLVELAMRPIRASCPSEARQTVSTSGVARRLAILVTMVTFIAGGIGGALSRTRGDSAQGHLLAVYIVAGAAAALCVAIVVPLVTATVTEPTRGLIDGTRAVAAGDLSVRVPIGTKDEFGELAQSFNEMVAGLREREALREHNAGLTDSLRESRARIVAASDAERRRMERDLHDGAQQHLVLMRLKVGLAQKRTTDPEAVEAVFDELVRDLDAALVSLRDLARGIYPTVLTADGLPVALAEAAARAAIPATVSSDASGRYGTAAEAAVYFCCVEALQNAAKHAGQDASAEITLTERGGTLEFRVSDNGVGFAANGVPAGSGLQNMQDRIGALGGTLTLESRPGAGVVVSGVLPL